MSISTELTSYISLFSVCLGAGITLLSQYYIRLINIKRNAKLFKFYIEDIRDDLTDLLDLINDQKVDIGNNNEAGAITNGAFMFNILDKIDFNSILSHLRRKEKNNT